MEYTERSAAEKNEWAAGSHQLLDTEGPYCYDTQIHRCASRQTWGNIWPAMRVHRNYTHERLAGSWQTLLWHCMRS